MKNEDKVAEIKDKINSLFDELNQFGNEQNVTEALNSVLNVQHRTLQQNFFKNLIIPSIKIFAEKKKDKNFDMRNEASCELAEKLQPIAEDACLPFI
jgi:hypothetical protein